MGRVDDGDDLVPVPVASWPAVVVDVNAAAGRLARALVNFPDGPLIGPPAPSWDEFAGDDDDRGLIG